MPSFEPRPCIGVDIGGTNVSAAVVDSNHRPVRAVRRKTRAHLGHQSVLDRIGEIVALLRDEAGLKRKQIAGLGVGVPGPVDMTHGKVMDAPNLGWKQLDIRDSLERITGLSTILDNDVNLALYGEVKAGAAVEYEDCLGIWTGTGVGGALVLSGRLYRGPQFTAGEIGHTTVLPGAGLGRETLEQLASRTAIVGTLTDLMRSSHPSTLSAMVDADYAQIRSKIVSRAVLAGDSLAIRVVRDAARLTGIAAANLITTLSLPCVVLGGGLATALGDPWAEWVGESVAEHVWPESLPEVKVLIAALGDDSGTIGAAIAARESCGSD